MIERDIIWLPAHRPSMREILARVAENHGLEPERLRASRHSHKLGPARQHAMFEMHARGFSNMQIAGVLNLADHSTVVKGRQAHERRLREGAAA